jgi:phosphoribosylglycinamide formyltransferase-1
MKICLLTYDAPHLKTAQVFNGLLNRGFSTIDFLLMPFERRPEREVVFQHRPFQFCGPAPQSLAGYAGSKTFAYEQWRSVLGEYDHFIVCGSNLIETDFANSGKVLNVHAGLIPAVRGLDSFKWAIFDGKPLGNTLHIIDENTDAGEVLGHCRTPVFLEDDLQTLANRHYENEIWMLVNFDAVMEKANRLTLTVGEPTKRMPSGVEQEMVRKFDAYKGMMAASNDPRAVMVA